MSSEPGAFDELLSVVAKQKEAAQDLSIATPEDQWLTKVRHVVDEIVSWIAEANLDAHVERGFFPDLHIGLYESPWLRISTPLRQQIIISPRAAAVPEEKRIGVIEISHRDRYGWIYYSPAQDEWRVSRKYLRDQSDRAVADALANNSVEFSKDSFARLLLDLILTENAA